jgi:hypothetical protein
MHSGNNNHGALDCFCLDSGGFVPSGVMKPGAGAGTAKSRPVGPDKAIWIEGEAAARSTMNRHPWWYDKVKADALSGGAWMSNFNDDKAGTADYDFDVLVADEYTFWVRANPLRSELYYRLDGGDWRRIDLAAGQRGRMNIAADNKPDMRFIAWAKVGKTRLSKGRHTISFRMSGPLHNHGGLDCFCLARIPFVPSGVMKPSEAVEGAAGPADWFAVVFDDDEFSPESVIDMSRLADAPAGKQGFLKRDGDALRFERSREPVKFWGCGSNVSGTRKEQTQRIRYLRKHGVNMVRQHTVFSAVGPLRGGRFDAKLIDDFDWWFAEIKRNGIYMTWSVFYPHHGPCITAQDGYELFDELNKDKRGLGNIGGLVNVERGIQDILLRYVKALLAHKNPYTGLRYADDPALAVLEIQNEDCVFFHVPLNDLRDGKKFPRHTERFRKRWGGWLKKRYASEADLKRAWGRLRPGDSWAGGTFETMGAYHFGGDGPLYEYKGQLRRAGDFIHFLTDVQREYYTRREKEVRAAGFRGVTVTTAWFAGGPAADPANTFCDTACDMIDRHNYFGGGDGGHGITEGKVASASHLSQPGRGLLSSAMYQVAGRPFSMTEWSHLPPSECKFEAAPLFAFYGMGLQGWDASYHFLNGRTRQGDGWPALSKYVTDTPHYIGQFPALAFAVRRGHVKEGDVVAARRLAEDDLYTGTDVLKQDMTGGATYDFKSVKTSGLTPTESIAVGRVTVSFEGGANEFRDLAPFWDREGKVLRSTTGQLTWDYGRRCVTVDTGRTAAVIGDARGREVRLSGVTVSDVKTPFMSLILTPLDDEELAQSRHILITAMARDRQTNARYNADASRLEVVGGPPLLMEPVQATLRLGGSPPLEVNVLDVYGVPTGRKVAPGAGGAFTIDGTHRTYYYEVKR